MQEARKLILTSKGGLFSELKPRLGEYLDLGFICDCNAPLTIPEFEEISRRPCYEYRIVIRGDDILSIKFNYRTKGLYDRILDILGKTLIGLSCAEGEEKLRDEHFYFSSIRAVNNGMTQDLNNERINVLVDDVGIITKIEFTG